MTTEEDWLAIERLVGDSGFELWDANDGDPELAPHEPSDAELAELRATVAPEHLDAQRASVDAFVAAPFFAVPNANAPREDGAGVA